ncbi:MAG: response regulator [Gammaproteobacteria bacterium]|nr:response regulator [Gammaproteobacteria bacterium]
MIIEYIAQHGCQVWVASTATEALQIANKQSFVLIFMDVGLPDGDGLEVSRAIRGNPDCPNHQTPIVVVTAHLTSAEGRKQCYEVGVNTVINKPLSIEKVNTAMQYMKVAAHLPIFDLKQAITFHRDEETAKAVLRLFVDDLTQAKQQFNQLYQQQDWEGLRKAIHRQHGAGLYSGTSRLNHIFGKMQEALTALTVDQEVVTRHYQQLLQHIDEIIMFSARQL